MKSASRVLSHVLLPLGCACFFLPLGQAADVVDCSLVPGWRQEGKARHYMAENLYEYVDGSAEAYVLYGFQQLQGVTCEAGEDSIAIDASEMTDAEAAYGIFAANRDPRRPIEKIGMGGQILAQRAAFAKGNYYIELTATPDNDHTPALTAFVAAIEKRLGGRTQPPDELAWFLPERLATVRLIPESVLGIPDLRRGYVAEYDQGKAFVVVEPSAQSATAILDKLRRRFPDSRPAAVGDEAFQAQDKYLGGVCFFRKGKYLGGYANLPDGPSAAGKSIGLAERLH
jgi:hypothetical protein